MQKVFRLRIYDNNIAAPVLLAANHATDLAIRPPPIIVIIIVMIIIILFSRIAWIPPDEMNVPRIMDLSSCFHCQRIYG